jgi:hypothetical protein
MSECSQSDNCKMNVIIDATLHYCDYLIKKLSKITNLSVNNRTKKIEKVYTLCNHALKIEYRNPRTWQLLGELYDFI